MNDLLELAIAAHGGMKRWNQLSNMTASVAIGGGLWPAKGKGGILDEVQVIIDCHTQRVTYLPFGAADRRSVYRPTLVAIETIDGQLIESRDNPRAAFAHHVRETQWDDLDLVYFSSYAMWTYLSTPFLFATPGFACEEIAPWDEDGEVWRRLRVRFPDHVASHSKEQVFYFSPSGILTRHDYAAEILGGLPAANYASEPKEFAGLIVPTKRRVYARAPDGLPVKDRVAVSIDIRSIIAT
jgi:hypothetical protein